MRTPRLPVLLNENYAPARRLHPIKLSIEKNLSPPSTASMILAKTEADINVGDFAELFTLNGSEGLFRVLMKNDSITGTVSLSFEHSIRTLADHIIPGESEDQTVPVKDALQTVLSHQSLWKLGTIDVPDDVTVTWKYNYSNLFESLQSVMKELPGYMLTFDQSQVPWVLNVVEKTDEDASECRLTRNMTSVKVQVDRSELCTKLYVPGVDDPLQADTIDVWGDVSRSISGDAQLEIDELLRQGREYLEKHKNPKVTITIDALDLSDASGESFDRFYLGKICRVCLPRDRVVYREQVVSISTPDVFGKPEAVKVTLANEQDTTASIIAGLIVDTTYVRKYANGNRTLILEAQDLIRLVSDKVEIQATDIELNASKIITLQAGVEENKASLELQDGRITANANEIALQANDILTLQAGVNDNAASILLTNNLIEAKADKIDLQGLVTATELETVKASISNLTSGLTTALVLNANTINGNQINGTYGDFDVLTHNSELVSQRSITMGSMSSVGKVLSTGGEIDLQHSHAVTVNDDGTITLGEVSAKGGNFNIADTKAYKDGVSAAVASVGFSSFAASGGVITPKLTNDKTTTYYCFAGTGDKDNKIPIYIAADQNGSGSKQLMTVDALDAYQAQYAAGWAAAVAKIILDRNLIKGPGSNVDSQVTLYTVTAGGSIDSITNTAANYMFAKGYGRAYINDTQVDNIEISKGQLFSLGQ